MRLLDILLERCRADGLLPARGQQRTDATHVLAAIRVLNRLELVGETLRAALNTLATEAPAWLQSVVPAVWYTRYATRIEDTRLPHAEAKRAAYAQTVGEDGYALLDALAAPEAPDGLQTLPHVVALRQTWQRHYARTPVEAPTAEAPGRWQVRFKANKELAPAGEALESPYDADARYRHKRDTAWTGYMVHVSETCDPTTPHLLTHVHTTSAAVHEAQCTMPIQDALLAKDLAPGEHLVDAAYVSAEHLATSQTDHGIRLRGPTRPNQSWQAQVDGSYRLEHFTVDWEHQQVRCPQGQTSVRWLESTAATRGPYIHVRFDREACAVCTARERCTRAARGPRALQLPPREHYEALEAARTWYASAEGRHAYQRRAGVEGTLSQGVRAFGLRQSRYRGLQKTHLQQIATAAAINLDRLVAWWAGRPRAQARPSRFAALAPALALPVDVTPQD